MGRVRFAGVAFLYVAIVVLLTAVTRFPAYRGDVLSFLALVLTLPTGMLYFLLEPVVHHLAVYALPVFALVNAFAVRRLVRALPRDPVARDVEDRLHSALVSTRLKVTPMRHAEQRQLRSLLLRDVPIPFPQLVGVYRELWRESGLRVQERSEPLALRAYDAEGYEFSLEAGPGYFGDAVLQVTAPPRRRRFMLGLAVGGVLGVGPAVLVWHPALLVTGVFALVAGLACLARPRSRSLGGGLLLGGVAALVGFVVFTLLRG